MTPLFYLLLGHGIYLFFGVIYHVISHFGAIYHAIYHVKCSFDLLLGGGISQFFSLCTAFFRDIPGRTWLYIGGTCLYTGGYHNVISQRWYVPGYGGMYQTNVCYIIWYMTHQLELFSLCNFFHREAPLSSWAV